MSDKATQQQIDDILRVLQGDPLAKTPGVVSEVNRSTLRVRKLSRDVTKLTETAADHSSRIAKLEDSNREQEIEIVKLKARQRLMWKIITGGLGTITALGGTITAVGGTVGQWFS